MARRIILGNNGGEYQFKVSAAGYDAATADLDGLLFDADNIPARVAASGRFTAPATEGFMNPSETTRSHGAANIAAAFAIAKPIPDVEGSTAYWYYGLRLAPGQGGSTTWYVLENAHMTDNYCTPFYWEGDDAGGGSYVSGWRFIWNSTSVVVQNFAPDRLDVRWVALEF